MGKATKRVLSMILAVLMAVSSVSVFCIPAAAAVNSEPVTTSPFVDLESVSDESADVIDESNLDYEALRKNKDTFIINGAWTENDLKAGNTLTYYFRGETHSITYNAKRHFSNFTDAYKVYTSELSADNILTWVPVFIFAPGDYADVMNIHGNGILLGSNAGTSPNDNSVDWDYKNFADGWKANKNWDSRNASVLNAYVFSGTRVNTSMEGIFHYYLEQAKSAAGGKAEYECVIDGMTLGSGFAFDGNGWDTGAQSAVYNGNIYNFTATSGTVSDKHIQNSVVDGVKGAMFVAHDTSHRIVTAYMTDVRVSSWLGSYLVHKYHKDAFLTRCSFDGNTKPIMAQNENDSFSSKAVRRGVQNEQYFVMRDCAYTNGKAGYPFKFGMGKDQSSSVTLIFDNNIFYNSRAASGSQYGIIYPDQLSEAGGKVTSIVINNQFFQDTVTLYAIFNTNAKDKYQVSPYNIHVENNTFVGMIDSPSTTNILEDDAALEVPYVVNNFIGATEESTGRHAYYRGAQNLATTYDVTSGFANGFDFTTAPYYLDYEMTTLSTDFAVNGISGLPENTEYDIDDAANTIYIDATNWTDAEKTSVVSPVFSTVSEDCYVEFYLDKELTQLSNSIDLSKLGEVAQGYAVVKHEEYPDTATVYEVTLVKAVVYDYNAEFNAAVNSGTPFSHLNLDPENTYVYIPGLEEGDSARGFFDGKYYEFTAESGNYPAVTGNISVIKAAYNLELKATGTAPAFNIILPSGEYDALELSVPATYYGVNANIDPNVKGDEETDEWTLNPAWGNTEKWGSLGETGIGLITVPAGLEGKVTLNGITMRNRLVDTARTTDSGNLSINIENVVVNHLESNDSSTYLFDLGNARSTNSGNAAFGETYADEFNVKNFFVKSVKASTRLLSENSARSVSFDNIYVDFAEAGDSVAFQSIFAWFKNGSANTGFDFSLTNSMLRDYDSDATALSMFCFQPQYNSAMGVVPEYNINISDNVLYNAVNSTVLFEYSPSYTKDFTLKNNYIVGNGSSKVIGVSEKIYNYKYWTDENGDGLDDIAVANKLYEGYDFSGNDFIGFRSNDTTFDMAIPETAEVFKNCYITSNKTPDGLDGAKVMYGEEDFWLDYGKNHTISEFCISGIDRSENFGQFVIDHSNLEISFVCEGGIIKESDFRLSSLVESGNLTDFSGVSKSTINISGDEGVVNYYYTIEGTVDGVEYSRKYAVKIYTYYPEEFKTSSKVDEAIRDFWIVDELAVGDEGAPVVLSWDGSTYEFEIGANAFASIADAYDYAQSEGVTANLLINSWNGSLNIDYPVNVYAPNWNTAPFNEDKTVNAATSAGADWTENEDYFDSQVTVENIVIGAGTSGGTVGIYGFTFTGVIQDNKRPKNSEATRLTFKNIVKDGEDGGGGAYIYQPSNSNTRDVSNVGQNDVLDIINFYIRKVFATQRIIGEYVPAYTTIDGLWCDAERSALNNQCTWVKQNADKAAFTIKNSNLRNFHKAVLNKSEAGIMRFEGKNDGTNAMDVTEGMDSIIVFDNNIMTEFYGQMGADVTAYTIGWTASSYTGFTFTNNFVDGGINEATANENSKDTTGFFHSAVSKTCADLDYYGTVRIVGNTFNGINSGFQVDSNNVFVPFTFEVYDNFIVLDRTEDVTTAVGVAASVGSKHKRTGETYSWLDFARTKRSDAIYDFKFLDAENVIVDKGGKTVYYKPAADDTMVTSVTADGVTTYTLTMADLVAENTYGNKFTLAYGKTSANMLTKSLTVEVDEGTDPVTLKMTVTSSDTTVKEEWSLVISDNIPVFVNGTVVSGTNVTFNSSKFTMDTSKGITDIINADAAASVTYSLDGTDYVAMDTPFTVDSDPEKIFVNVDGALYTLYIVTDEISAELTDVKVGDKSVTFASDAASVTLEANSDMTFTYSKSKYATVTVKDGETPVNSFDVENGSSKTYTVSVKESVLNTEKTYTLTVTVNADTNKIETIKKMIATTVFAKDYTAATIAALDAAIIASDAIDTSTASQEEIDAAYNAIETAYNALIAVADMNTALDKAKTAINSGDYCNNAKMTALKNAVATLEAAVETETDKAQANAKTAAVNNAVSALDKHSFGNYTSNNDATCMKNGTKSAKCACGVVSTVEDANTKISHKFTKYNYNNDATCIADGHESAYCDYGCGTKDTIVKSDTQLEHSFTNYVLGEDGSMTAVCDYGCGAKDVIEDGEDPIDPEDPSDGEDEIIDSSKIFEDVKDGSWYEIYVDYVYEHGLMNGTSSTTFEPNTTMTRAMTVTIIARMAGVDTDASKNSSTKFTDVETGKWYTGAVVWAVENGITTGTSATTFSPNDAVTRQDLCVLLVRFADVAGIKLHTYNEKTVFPDDASISDYAKDAVYACQMADIVNGTSEGTFDPKGNATRSAVAKMITIFHIDYISLAK